MLDLLDAKTLGQKLKVSPSTAKALMISWGVPYVHLGVGRGKGLRWASSDVEAALTTRTTDPSAAEPEKKSTKKREKSGYDKAVEYFASPPGRLTCPRSRQ